MPTEAAHTPLRVGDPFDPRERGEGLLPNLESKTMLFREASAIAR